MLKRTIVSLILFLIGEVVIIGGFVHYWPESGDSAILVIDIIVTTLIWTSISYDLFIPWVNLASNNPREPATIGIRWIFVFGYAFAAIAIMFLGSLLGWSTFAQGGLQIVAFMVLFAGFVLAGIAGDKVESVGREEQNKSKGIESARLAINQLYDEIALSKGLPTYLEQQIGGLKDSLRFVSPCSKQEAQALEKDIVQLSDHIRFSINNFQLNEENIKKDIRRLNQTVLNRKNILQ